MRLRVVRKNPLNTTDKKQPTISDVANIAGVSAATVSRIINNRPDVSPETRQRVEKVIAEMGYVPYLQAQALRIGRTRTVSMLYPFDTPGTLVELDFIMGAMQAASDESYFFNLMMNPLNEQALLSLLLNGQVDGFVLCQVHLNDWRVHLLRKNNFPFSLLGRTAGEDDMNLVDLDIEACVYGAIRYLHSIGHRNIGFISYPQYETSFSQESDYGPYVRAQSGFQRAIKKFNLEPLFQSAGYTIEELEQATHCLLEEQPDLEAILVADGGRAMGVINALNQCGKNVPNDVSIIGIAPDGAARLIAPSLTTIDFPAYQMGYQATRLLIKDLKREQQQVERLILPAKLIVRKSTIRRVHNG